MMDLWPKYTYTNANVVLNPTIVQSGNVVIHLSEEFRAVESLLSPAKVLITACREYATTMTTGVLYKKGITSLIIPSTWIVSRIWTFLSWQRINYCWNLCFKVKFLNFERFIKMWLFSVLSAMHWGHRRGYPRRTATTPRSGAVCRMAGNAPLTRTGSLITSS
jgi:hypothetical protein